MIDIDQLAEVIGSRIEGYAWKGWRKHLDWGAGNWWRECDIVGFRAMNRETGITITLRRRRGEKFVGYADGDRRQPVLRPATAYQVEIGDPERVFGGPAVLFSEGHLFMEDDADEQPDVSGGGICRLLATLLGKPEIQDDEAMLQRELETLFARLEQVADFDYARKNGARPTIVEFAAVI